MSDVRAARAAATGLEGAGGSALAANLFAFARLLRRTGLPIGVSEGLHGLEALSAIDLSDRRQVHAALRAVMVHRREHLEIFDQAFLLFWRDPEAGRNAAAMALMDGMKSRERAPPTARRIAEAMRQPAGPPPPPRAPEEERREMNEAIAAELGIPPVDLGEP